MPARLMTPALPCLDDQRLGGARTNQTRTPEIRNTQTISDSVAIVTTDHYGNPCPISGNVELTGAVTATVSFHDEWRSS